ncbi:hypothetical protein [Winogradskyella ouciana]|uniref:GH26 domain-containing protein n=1 Tax=Winogradskyella ouciana TaxID=2608631 RepID=A0A7K1G8Z7_9FLAO|nr:hypothetical protein [Winogradskyella ouciana]MTE25752.1 hypothetical protein [Winogradskyella ouciana]
MKSILTYILIFCILFACKKEDESSTFENTNAHIEYFGFTIVDTFWDDPTDSEAKTNYADEIHNFSNIADILIVNPNDNIVQRAQTFADMDLKAILHLNELFFELIDNNSPSESNYNLRTDYQERWNEFKTINQSIINNNYVGTFYIGEEPTWNGITFTELNAVAQLLQTEFPNIPTMIIEAYPSLNDLQVPETIDWIGFDRYFVENPNTNVQFQQDWNTLKSKLSNPNQKIMVILDSHYINWAHGDFGNIELTRMNIVAQNYYELAKSDEKVIGVLGYFWPNGFDIPESIGARGMPQNVKMEYERIGKEITGKNN